MISSLVGLGLMVSLVVAGFLFRVGMFIADDLRSRYERARWRHWYDGLSDEEFDALCAEDYEPQCCADEEDEENYEGEEEEYTRRVPAIHIGDDGTVIPHDGWSTRPLEDPQMVLDPSKLNEERG